MAAASADVARSIIELASRITADRKRLLESPTAGSISDGLFELLPMVPRFSVEHVRQRLDDLGILAEPTEQKKNPVYSHQAYVELLCR